MVFDGQEVPVVGGEFSNGVAPDPMHGCAGELIDDVVVRGDEVDLFVAGC